MTLVWTQGWAIWRSHDLTCSSVALLFAAIKMCVWCMCYVYAYGMCG